MNDRESFDALVKAVERYRDAIDEEMGFYEKYGNNCDYWGASEAEYHEELVAESLNARSAVREVIRAVTGNDRYEF